MGKSQWEPPSDVSTVYSKLAAWRSSREKRTAVPSEIWSAATALAQRYGVYRISQALRLNYGTLKRRVVDASSKVSQSTIGNTEKAVRCEFVELSGGGKMSTPAEHEPASIPGSRSVAPVEMEIEVFDGVGARMTVRLSDGARVGVTELVSSFWAHSR